MRKFIQKSLRVAIDSPLLGRPIAGLLASGYDHWQQLRNEEYLEAYRRHREFTRLPVEAFTANLDVVQRHAPPAGCVVECGVWRGGMSAGMAEILGPERDYYLFDSFEGLPEAQSIDGESAAVWLKNNRVDACRVESAFAERAMSVGGATRVHIVKGWFEESMPKFKPAQPIAVLRLDADWYSSTAQCLNYLYPFVCKGGLVIFDDYFVWDGCARAVHDFLSKNALSERIKTVGNLLAYIIKTDTRPIEPIDPNRAI